MRLWKHVLTHFSEVLSQSCKLSHESAGIRHCWQHNLGRQWVRSGLRSLGSFLILFVHASLQLYRPGQLVTSSFVPTRERQHILLGFRWWGLGVLPPRCIVVVTQPIRLPGFRFGCPFGALAAPSPCLSICARRLEMPHPKSDCCAPPGHRACCCFAG